MFVLAAILLAYILEPVLKADDESVEIDTAVDAPQIPDFRALLEDVDDLDDEPARAGPASEAVAHPEPAEHRTS